MTRAFGAPPARTPKAHAAARRALAVAAAVFFLTALLPSVARASAQTTTATLSGAVLDEAGAVIPGVEITVLNLSTALERHAVTNGEGVYVIPLLPPGRYHVTAAREGFTTVEHRGVALNVGDQLALRIKLKVGEIGESVTVYDGQVWASRESAAVGAVVNRQFVENLPLNGRSFQTLLELAPGTTLTRTSFNEQGQFSASGQRANANYFMVDGVSANVGVSAGAAPGQAAAGSLPALTVLGGTNSLVSIEAVEEFQIQTSTYAPEFGRTPGAQVSVVTRAGTNELHGSLFEYFRNDALDANDWFANSRGLKRAALRQNDFGGTLGGPLSKDRTFFFVSYEGLRLRQPQVALSDVPSLATRSSAPAPLRPFLNAFPLPNGDELAGGFAEFAASYSDRAGFDALSGRVDHIFSDRLTLFGRYNIAPSETTQRGGASVPGFAGQSLNTVSRTSLDTRTLTVGATMTLSPNVLDELRVNWSRVEGETTLMLDDFGGAAPPPASLLFPDFASPDASGFQFSLRGGANSSFGVGKNVSNLQRQLNVVNNLSIIRGRNHLKFGADYRRLTPVYGPLRYAQSVIFGGAGESGIVTALSTGRAFEVRVAADAEPREPVFTNFSAYAQNTTRVTPRLTVTYGLRWELNPPPHERNGKDPVVLTGLDDEGFSLAAIIIGGGVPPAGTNLTLDLAPRGTPLWRTPRANFAPRAGAAYLLSPSRGTTLRGGFGVFHDLGTGQAAQAFGSVFPFMKEKVLTNVTFPLDPTQAEPPPVNLDPPFGAVYAFIPDLKLPLTFQWSGTVEHPLGASQAVSASYVGALGRRLLRQTALVRPDSRFTLVRLTSNTSASDYHALQLQFARRLSRGLQAHASYTWARATDDDSDDSSRLLFTGIFERERAPANFDVRHSLVAAATYHLPNPLRSPVGRALAGGWHLDAIFRARTATPVNIFLTTGAILNDLLEARRPDLVSGVPLYIDDPLAAGGRRLNRAAFAAPAVGQQGTLGRNAVRGFGFTQLDAGLRREFRLSERLNLQLRADVFNVFNHPSFGDPDGDLGSPRFGESRQTLARSLGTGGANGGLSPLYQVGGPRSVQLAVRLQF